MPKPRQPSHEQLFNYYMELMTKGGEPYEHGYHFLLGQLDEFLDDLIDAYKGEEYIKIRDLILELLCESSDERLLPIMEQGLINESNMIRCYAIQGLATINNRQARMILREAQHNIFPDEYETKEFRDLVKYWLEQAESKYKK